MCHSENRYGDKQNKNRWVLVDYGHISEYRYGDKHKTDLCTKRYLWFISRAWGMHSKRISPNKKCEKLKKGGVNVQFFRCDVYYPVVKLRNNK